LRRFGSPRRLSRTARWLLALLATIRRRRREPLLTVAVDVNSLYEPLTGVGWYVHELLAHLADAPDLRLRLYGQSLVEGDGGTPRLVVDVPPGTAVERVVYDAPDGLVVPPWRARQFLRRLAPLLAAADGNRVLFAPNYIAPRLFRFASGARVATVHDLTLHRLPAAARPDTAAALVEELDRTLHSAAMLVTPSEAVRAELVARGIAASRVRAIHHGSGQLAGTAGQHGASEPDVPAPQIPPLFGLYVGTLEPRKNLPLLLAAWRRVWQLDPATPPLVLAGRWGWHAGELTRAVSRGTAEGWLLHLGYVPPAGLAALYRGALLLALPSLYEGFGLPIVEAFAAGTPVLASDLPVLHEVAGDAALFAPPDDVEAWASALARLLADADFRDSLASRGAERAAHFDWRRSAAAHVDAWRAAATREGR
jgi:alpha-1,3-rhamnosyl/mannosyltransferase